MGTPRAGAALGVNLRMLEHPLWLTIALALGSKPPAWQNCSFFKIQNWAYWHKAEFICRANAHRTGTPRRMFGDGYDPVTQVLLLLGARLTPGTV